MAWLSRLPKRRIVLGLDLDEDETPAASDRPVHQVDSRSVNEEVGTLGTPEQKRKRLRKRRIVEDKENAVEPERQSGSCPQPSFVEDCCEPERPTPHELATPRRWRRLSTLVPSNSQEGSLTVAERPSQGSDGQEHRSPWLRAESSQPAVLSDPIEIPDTQEDPFVHSSIQTRELQQRQERSRRQSLRDRAMAQRLQVEEEQAAHMAHMARMARARHQLQHQELRQIHSSMLQARRWPAGVRWEGREFTANDYETLLQLDDATDNRRDMGEVQRLISLLPSSKLPAGAASRDCSICMDKMQVGQEVKTLPCMHVFHSECIDRWLLESKKGPCCPIDQEDVRLE